MRVLFAEDEQDLNNIITMALKQEGYSVDPCFDGEEAYDYLSATEYDVAILDVMMPKMDGFQVLKKIRDEGNKTPVLMLTARDSVEDRVYGLDNGADDYLVKPFSIEELKARLRVLTRVGSGQKSSVLVAGDLSVDIASHKVMRGDREIELSSKEFSLLEYMMHNQDIVLSREKIEDHIWNFDYEGGTNVVDVYISYLRKKIDEGENVKLIKTVRGVGYKLSAEQP